MEDYPELKLSAIKLVTVPEWMSDADSGPEGTAERRTWLAKIGCDKDRRGKPCDDLLKKKAGKGVLEVVPHFWRSDEVSFFCEYYIPLLISIDLSVRVASGQTRPVPSPSLSSPRI